MLIANGYKRYKDLMAAQKKHYKSIDAAAAAVPTSGLKRDAGIGRSGHVIAIGYDPDTSKAIAKFGEELAATIPGALPIEAEHIHTTILATPAGDLEAIAAAVQELYPKGCIPGEPQIQIGRFQYPSTSVVALGFPCLGFGDLLAGVERAVVYNGLQMQRSNKCTTTVLRCRQPVPANKLDGFFRVFENAPVLQTVHPDRLIVGEYTSSDEGCILQPSVKIPIIDLETYVAEFL